MEVPPDSLQREEVSKNDLGRRSPWWGGRKEGTSDLQHSWSHLLVGFAKQGGGDDEPKGGLGNRTAAVAVEETGACAAGTPIQTTSRRGVDHVLNSSHHQEKLRRKSHTSQHQVWRKYPQKLQAFEK